MNTVPLLLGLGLVEQFDTRGIEGIRASVRSPHGDFAYEGFGTLGVTPARDASLLATTLSVITGEPQTFDRELATFGADLTWGPFGASPVRPELVLGGSLRLVQVGSASEGSIRMTGSRWDGGPLVGLALGADLSDHFHVRLSAVDAIALRGDDRPALGLDLCYRVMP